MEAGNGYSDIAVRDHWNLQRPTPKVVGRPSFADLAAAQIGARHGTVHLEARGRRWGSSGPRSKCNRQGASYQQKHCVLETHSTTTTTNNNNNNNNATNITTNATNTNTATFTNTTTNNNNINTTIIITSRNNNNNNNNNNCCIDKKARLHTRMQEPSGASRSATEAWKKLLKTDNDNNNKNNKNNNNNNNNNNNDTFPNHDNMCKLREKLMNGYRAKLPEDKSMCIPHTTRLWMEAVKPRTSRRRKICLTQASLLSVSCFLKLHQAVSSGSHYMGAKDTPRSGSQKMRAFPFSNQGLKKGLKSSRANPWDRGVTSKLAKAKGKVGTGAGVGEGVGVEKEINNESGKEKEVSVPKKNQRPRNSLLWWFKVIKAVCRLALDMKILAMCRTDHEAASEAYYQYVVGPNTDVTLFFDKRLFSRKRGSQVPLWAQAITVKKPQFRTDRELDNLDGLMMTVRSYREKFQCTMRKSACQVFRYTNCERGRIVLRQNHRGVGFYLVYSGSLYVQKELEEKTGHKQTGLENIIRSGQHFGEVALLGDGLRTATVICREPSELFYIEKDDFATICPQLFDEELAEKIKFVQRFELFKDWQDLNLHKLCLQSQVLYISHGQIIEADWLQTRYLYFVMQGCISLLKKFQVQQTVKQRHSPMNSAKHEKGQQQQQEQQQEQQQQQQQQQQEEEQEKAQWSTCVAVVGHLHSGDHSELSVLGEEDQVSGISMKSDGVRVLRLSTRNTLAFSEGDCVQKFLQKYQKPKIPSDEELCKNYHNSSKWNKFKKQMLYTQLLQKNGAATTATAATSGL